MRLTQIRDFVAVVESGSIRAAARKLRISQPAITKSVRGLETELHVRLLQRTPQGIVPTSAGRAFFTRARVAHAELLKAEEEATQAEGGSAGSVAFGVGPAAAVLVVPEAVLRFRQQFPDAQVRIVEGFPQLLFPLIRDETLDFTIGVRTEAKLDAALEFHPLFRHDYVVVARKGHPLRNARSLAQLAGGDWITLIPLGASGGPLDRTFSAVGLSPPKQSVRCDSFNTAIALLAKTDMLGLFSRRLLSLPLARDVLQEIPVTDSIPSYAAGIFTRRDSPPTRLGAAMAKAVTAVARRLARPV